MSSAIDIATEHELRDLFCMDADDELEATIQTCGGEWRRAGELWHFHIDDDVAPVPMEYRQ